MIPALHIAPATAFHPHMETLRAEAAGEGFRFMDNLIGDWLSGANRFDRPGEHFLGAFQATGLLAVCGLNRDPFTDQDGVGRLRHLYVRKSARRRGVASMLVHQLLTEAEKDFYLVRLRTDTRGAATFYAGHGFVPIVDRTASHAKSIQQL